MQERHVVVVKPSGTLRAYIGYAQRMLADPAVAQVRFEAQGKAVGKAVTVAEIVKRGQSGLHQVSDLTTANDGSGQSFLSITLATSADLVDVKHVGYTPPSE